jgi:predicted N-acyltransferase
MISPVIIADTIRSIPKEQWDALTGENPLSSYGWLLSVEEALIKAAIPRYFVFHDNEKIKGAAICYMVERNARVMSLDYLFWGRLQPMVNSVGISFLPALICCPFKSSGQHILLADDLDDLQKQRIARQILDVMESESARRKMAMGFPQVHEQEEVLIRLLIERGYHRTLDRPLTYLDISWDSFEGYKACIRGKSLKWKRNIAQDVNKNYKSGVRIEKAGDDFFKQDKQMVELLNRNYLKHNRVDLPFSKNILRLLKMNLNKDVDIYRSTKNGGITGLSVMLKKNGTWSFILVGIDHALARNDATYFNIIFYRPIMDAITAQIKRIYYGNGLYDMKIRRGCGTIRTFAFYRPYHPIFNLPVKAWFHFHRFWYQKKFDFSKTRQGHNGFMAEE